MGAAHDIIVVGAGLIGLSAAWRAADEGLDVLVVDRDRPGGGATGVAAGMLAPVTEAAFGEDDLLALNLESARRWPAFLEDLSRAAGTSTGLEFRPVSHGTLAVAVDRDQLEALRRLHDFQRSLGLDAGWLDRSACRTLEPALHPSVRGGVLVPGDREVDPRRIAAAVAAAMVSAGGDLRTGSPVVALEVRNGRCTGVRLGDGSVMAAGGVVLAAGCWSGRIEGVPAEVAAAVRPVKGQILRLRARPGDPPPCRHVLRTEEVYLVPRAGGGVVVGATVEERGYDDALTAGAVFELLRAATEVLPAVRELEVTEAGAGLRPGTPDNGPLVGMTSVAGVVAATGHYRNGILLAPVTADAVVAALTGRELPPQATPFTPERFAREPAGAR